MVEDVGDWGADVGTAVDGVDDVLTMGDGIGCDGGVASTF